MLSRYRSSLQPSGLLSNALQPSVSNDGSLAVLRNVPNNFQLNELSWVTLEGDVQPIGIKATGPVFPLISPDGKKVVYSLGKGFLERDIWLRDLDSDSSDRITFSDRMAIPSGWSSNQREIAIASQDDQRKLTVFYATDGSGKTRPELEVRAWTLDKAWKRFVTLNFDANDPFTICELDLDNPAEIKEILKVNGARPALSPDGTLVAYQSKSGQIFCKRIVESESLWQISRDDDGAIFSVWAADGSRLFYSSLDAIYVVEVFPEPTLKFGSPQKLIDAEVGLSLRQGWTVSPVGKRILALKMDRTENLDDAVSLITNWFEEFRTK